MGKNLKKRICFGQAKLTRNTAPDDGRVEEPEEAAAPNLKPPDSPKLGAMALQREREDQLVICYEEMFDTCTK